MFLGYVTAHRSRNESFNVRERGNRDGDKLLCNRCPLKHEARERERGVKCFTRTHVTATENLHREIQLIAQVHDICGMVAAIYKRVHNNLDP